MRDRPLAAHDAAAPAEAIRTVGLFMIVAAVSTIAVFLGSFGGTSAAVTVGAGITALLMFCGSVVCFAVDSSRTGAPPVPSARS